MESPEKSHAAKRFFEIVLDVIKTLMSDETNNNKLYYKSSFGIKGTKAIFLRFTMNIIEHVVKKCTSTGFSLLKTPYFIYLSNLCTHKGKPWKNVSIIENQDPINGWRIL